MVLTYEEAVSYLASLAPRGWRLGLDRMQAFVDRAGLSDTVSGTTTRYIHVAGTNGKGSVTAMLQSMLVEHGYRTGAFFSPYVVDPRERVQFGRDLISKSDFASIVGDLLPIAESFSDTDFGGITEFEFKTAVGFEFWRRMACEWVALEVGLGGRLDATNVITPACSAIVSIGLDHTAILGNTLAEIASEKAGIIKPCVPVVVGEMAPEARQAILNRAQELHAPAMLVGQDVSYRHQAGSVHVTTPKSTIDLTPSLVGSIQGHNAALAYAALEAALGHADQTAAQCGMGLAAVPGRMQVINDGTTRFILDGAHNADAASVLVQTMAERYPGRHVTVSGMVAGHDPGVFYSALAPCVSALHVSPIDCHRAVDSGIVAAAASRFVPATAHDSLASALAAAKAEAGPGGTVLVTGSFYLVGEAVRALTA